MNFLRVGFIILLTALAACGKSPSQPAKPLALVSIAPYLHFAEKIGGQEVEVRSIVPQSMNAHTFEPTPRQRESLKEAQIWFLIGEPFERPLLPVFPKEGRIVDLRDGIELLEIPDSAGCEHCGSDALDRHIWLSPRLAKQQARTIAEAFKKEFPDHQAYFEENLQQLLLELDTLDETIHALLDSAENRSLLVSHPAFGYFCRDYGLEQISVEYEGKDPRPKYLERLLESVKEAPPALSLALPQHNNKGIQIIAKELKMPLQIIDPYSSDYFSMMRSLADMLAPQEAPLP